MADDYYDDDPDYYDDPDLDGLHPDEFFRRLDAKIEERNITAQLLQRHARSMLERKKQQRLADQREEVSDWKCAPGSATPRCPSPDPPDAANLALPGALLAGTPCLSPNTQHEAVPQESEVSAEVKTARNVYLRKLARWKKDEKACLARMRLDVEAEDSWLEERELMAGIADSACEAGGWSGAFAGSVADQYRLRGGRPRPLARDPGPPPEDPALVAARLAGKGDWKGWAEGLEQVFHKGEWGPPFHRKYTREEARVCVLDAGARLMWPEGERPEPERAGACECGVCMECVGP